MPQPEERLLPTDLEIPDETLEEWQSLVDTMARLAGIPAGLIMRLTDDEIEVFVASRTDGNPYEPGDSEHFDDSGLYCETVIKSGEKLHVPNALADPDWKDNPDVKLGMISYLGYPITLPDGTPFGTLCILDSRPNEYTDPVHDLVLKFRRLIEHQLKLLYMNHALNEEHRRLIDFVKELKVLRGLVAMCAWCKKIQDSDGTWRPVESYLAKDSDAMLSHSICPTCSSKVRV